MDILDEIIIPGQEARYGDTPAWLSASPVWPAVRAQTGDGQLYLHQSMGLELIRQGHNLVISTGTASGKSLVFQAPTLHHLAANPNATAISVYPIKALARDQVIAGRAWPKPPDWILPPSTASPATCATSPSDARFSSAPGWP